MKGSYSVEKGIIRCPWHGACFNVQTGDIEDFPGLDSLPKYEVEQQNDGNIRIRGHFNINNISKRVPKCVMAEHEKSVVIIGGGARLVAYHFYFFTDETALKSGKKSIIFGSNLSHKEGAGKMFKVYTGNISIEVIRKTLRLTFVMALLFRFYSIVDSRDFNFFF